MKLYNTLSRTEEEFRPSQDNLVRMYACGLTVYSRGHIGNFRTFVAVDVLRRTLKYLEGYTVRQVVNFTDVDDRTIAGSLKADMPLREYTESVDRRVSCRTRVRLDWKMSRSGHARPTRPISMRWRTSFGLFGPMDTPTKATAPSISRSRRFLSTDVSRGWITTV